MPASVTGLVRRSIRALRPPRGARCIEKALAPVADNPEPSWRVVETGPLAGVEMLLPGAGCGWADSIVCHNSYELAFVPTLMDLARRGGTLYDVGAHVGFFTCAWLVAGGFAVEAFEPVPRNHDIVRQVAVRNGWSTRVHVHDLALGATDGTGVLQVNEADLGDSSLAYIEGMGGIDWRLRARAYPAGSTLSTTVRRLDALVEELSLSPPAVIKIDVEGGEADVIEGAVGVLSRHRPAILLEVHNVYPGMRLTERLQGLGYRLSILGKNHWLPACLWTPT